MLIINYVIVNNLFALFQGFDAEITEQNRIFAMKYETGKKGVYAFPDNMSNTPGSI